MKRYWHELKDSTIKNMQRKHFNWGNVMEKYLQPKWCSYPDALEGIMGCWSLVDFFDLRHKISIDYCKGCDCFIKGGLNEQNSTKEQKG